MSFKKYVLMAIIIKAGTVWGMEKNLQLPTEQSSSIVEDLKKLVEKKQSELTQLQQLDESIKESVSPENKETAPSIDVVQSEKITALKSEIRLLQLGIAELVNQSEVLGKNAALVELLKKEAKQKKDELAQAKKKHQADLADAQAKLQKPKVSDSPLTPDLLRSGLLDAMMRGHDDVVRILHRNGAELNVFFEKCIRDDKELITPYECVCQRGHSYVLDYVLSALRGKK